MGDTGLGELSLSSSLMGETLGISLRGHAQPVAGGKGGGFQWPEVELGWRLGGRWWPVYACVRLGVGCGKHERGRENGVRSERGERGS